MPRRVRVAAAAVIAILALAGMIFVAARIRSDESDVGQLRFASTSTAAAPFDDFGEARIAVGSECLRVLVASTPAQRRQGLRGVRSTAPYAGMLFAMPRDSTGRFTMADTLIPLDITFFSAQRIPVDSARMTPCPEGSDATCPTYGSDKPYRYALELPAGAGSSSASGPLGTCAA